MPHYKVEYYVFFFTKQISETMGTKFFELEDLTENERTRYSHSDEFDSIASAGVRDMAKKVIHSFKSSDDGITYQKDGKIIEPGDEYYAVKLGLLVVEVLIFVFFLTFGLSAFGLAVLESDVGTGTWPVGRAAMIAILVSYLVVGLGLLVAHGYLSIRFSSIGEEQLDDFLANYMALAAMYAITVGLFARYFTIGIDDSTDDHSLRRLIYVVVEGFGIFSAIIIVRSLCRHAAIAKVVHIDHQYWQGGLEIRDHPGQRSKNEQIVEEYLIKPNYGRSGFLVLMSVYTLALLGLTIWLLIKGGVAVSKVPHFREIYLTYFITMGILLGLLWIVWVVWSVESQLLKGSFSAHFDVYYLTHMILPVAVIFMLIGYRYVYSKVPDTFFDSAGTIVPALKFAYFQKIVMVQLLLLPLVAMGVAKGSLMLSNMFPVEIDAVKKRMALNKSA